MGNSGSGGEPQQPPGGEPQQPPGGEPQQPPGGEPQQPPGGEPQQPTGGEPQQPPGGGPRTQGRGIGGGGADWSQYFSRDRAGIGDSTTPDSFDLIQMDPRDLGRKQQVFVEPEGLLSGADFGTQRIFVVVGTTIEGTTTVAVNLALKLREYQAVSRASWETENPGSLIRINAGSSLNRINNILKHKAFEDDRIYIVKRVVERGLRDDEFSDEKLARYQDLLESRQTFVILTTTQEALQVRRRPARGIIDVREINRQVVFDRHLEVDFDVSERVPGETAARNQTRRDLLQAQRQFIVENANPAQIGEIFQQFAAVHVADAEALAGRLIEIIENVTDARRLQRAFFNGLNFNERLFGMLVALLNQPHFDEAITLVDAEELYHLTTQALVRAMRDGSLREYDLAPIDPRMTGVYDLVETLGISGRKPGDSVRFLEPQVGSNFSEQIVNYHRMLWVLSDLLIDIVDGEVRPYFSAMSVTLIARLIGQFGIYQRDRLRDLMHALLVHRETALAAALLVPSAVDTGQHPFLIDVLEKWVPGNKRLNWPQHPTEGPDNLTLLVAAATTLAQVVPPLHNLSRYPADEGIRKTAGATLRTIYKLVQRLVRQVPNHGDDTNRERTDAANQVDTFIRGYLKDNYGYTGRLVDAVRSGVPADDVGELRELRQRVIDEHTAYAVVNWIEVSLNFVLDAFQYMADSSIEVLEEVIALLIEMIESGLFEDTFDAWQARVEETRIKDIVAQLAKEDQPEAADEDGVNSSDPIVIKNAGWYVAVAIANHLFIERISSIGELSKSVSRQKVSAKDTAQTIDEPERAGANGAKAPSPDDEDDENDGDDEERDQDETEQPTQPRDDDEKRRGVRLNITASRGASQGGRMAQQRMPGDDDSSGIDGDSSGDAANQSEKQGQPQNLIDVYEYLGPMLRLLPVMLEASESYGNLGSFLLRVQHGDAVIRQYYQYNMKERTEIEELEVRFSSGIEERLTLQPMLVALFSLREWFGVVARDDQRRQEWLDAVYPVLLQLVNDATGRGRYTLRKALFAAGWVDSDHTDVRHIARAIIARSYVLDGMVMDLPLLAEDDPRSASRYGVVLLDATARPWAGMTRYSYFAQAFNLIQRLSVLTPIRVHYLGYTGESHLVGVTGDVQDSPLTSSSKLIPTRRRDRLLLPVLESDTIPPFTPGNTHFALVLAQLRSDDNPYLEREIVDLLDLVSMAVNPAQQAIQVQTWDPFAPEADPAQTSEEAADLIDWPWRDKFFLLTTTREDLLQQLNSAIYNIVKEGERLQLEADAGQILHIHEVYDTVMFEAQIEAIEQELQRQIVRNLHTLTPDDFRRDLARYQLGVDFSDRAALTEHLRGWVTTLDRVETAQHPRDVTLTIAWSILALAEEDMAYAVDLIHEWLTSGERLMERMGAALTRLLFVYYSERDIEAHITRARELLRLLKPFVAATADRDEYERILQIIIGWAQVSIWARELVAPEGEPQFLPAIRGFRKRSVIRHILSIVTYHEVEVGLRWVYARMDTSFDQFIELLSIIADYVDDYNERDRVEHRQAVVAEAQQAGFDLDVGLLELLESLCNTPVFRRGELAVRILKGIEREAPALRRESSRQAAATAHRNLRAVADSIRMELYHKLGDVLPPLRPDQRYGIILVDVASAGADHMISTSIILMRNIQRQLRQQQRRQDVVFTVHRLGRGELVFGRTAGAPTPKQLRIVRLREDAPLIGPILDQYQPEQVGFVMVLSAGVVIDLEDWYEQPDWTDRFWVYTLHDSWLARSRIEGTTGGRGKARQKKDVQQLSTEIMDKLGG